MTTTREAVRARRRQRRRRKAIATGAAVVVVAGGAGTAYAMSGSHGPRYRLATVTTGSVSQVVGADGTLAASRVADASFAVSGTVGSVAVAVGDRVRAGQTLATMDKTSLSSAVASAQNALAQAKETLTDDEDGTSTSNASGTPTTTGIGSATGGTTSTGSTTVTTRSAVTRAGDATAAVFTAARSSTTPSPGPKAGTAAPAGGSSTMSSAAAKVTAAAKALAGALNSELDTVATQCAATTSSSTSTVNAAADADGTISGSTGADTTSVSAGGQQVTPGPSGSWTLTGLTQGKTYTVTIAAQRSAVDPTTCSAAVDDARDSSSDVAAALTAFNSAVTALQEAARASGSGTGATGTGSGTGGTGTGSGTGGSRTGSGSKTGSGTGSGSTSGGSGTSRSTQRGTTAGSGSARSSSSGNSATGASGSTTVAVTSEKLAADVAAVAAAKAAVAVAQNQLTSAALTSPVTGTVASVGLSKGSTVSAGSSNDTIQVVGDGPLSVQLAIPLSAINLIKVGQSAHITVDGRTSALPARVTYVGLLNSSSSTGSSSTYTVTVELANATTGLYDGEGAQVSVDVGTASNALVVPLSALHTTGTRHTVNLYRGGTSAQTAVTVGVVGATSVQVKTGLASGQQVVLADTSEATPTSTTTSNRGAFEGGSFGTGPRGR